MFGKYVKNIKKTLKLLNWDASFTQIAFEIIVFFFCKNYICVYKITQAVFATSKLMHILVFSSTTLL